MGGGHGFPEHMDLFLITICLLLRQMPFLVSQNILHPRLGPYYGETLELDVTMYGTSCTPDLVCLVDMGVASIPNGY